MQSIMQYVRVHTIHIYILLTCKIISSGTITPVFLYAHMYIYTFRIFLYVCIYVGSS